jgi:hypothetical protein
MAVRTGYRTVVPAQPWNRDSTLVLQGAMNGKTNNVFDMTLATGTAVTQVSFPLINSLSYMHAVPTNTYAATLTGYWFDAQTEGAAILRHSAGVSLTASLRVIVVG